MNGTSTLTAVLADIVVVALTIGVLVCLALAMWLIVVVVLRVRARVTPAKRPSSPKSAGTSD